MTGTGITGPDDGILVAAERNLAENEPFGSYEYISAQSSRRYEELLSTIADSAPGARALLECMSSAESSLRRLVLGDPLVRRTIEDGACLYLLGLETISDQKLNEVLTAAAEYTKRRRAPLLAEATGCLRMGDAPHHGHIWTTEAKSNPATRRFMAQCSSRIPGLHIEQPTDESIKNISEGVKVVDSLLPDLGRSALGHTFMAVVATSTGGFEFSSLTVPGIPGVIFLAPRVLTSPARAADAVFHESMHLKLMDIDYAEQLYVLGFRPQLSPTVTPPWHSGDQQQWPLDRILTAMHVYTGLAVFYGRMQLVQASGQGINLTEDSAGPIDAVGKYERAVQRARCLLEMSQSHPDVFSPAGRSFIDWVAGIQRHFDASSLQPERPGEAE